MALLPVLVALGAALGGCWGTNSPTVVFDPNNPGGGNGGGGGGGGVLPPGASSAPVDGALLRDGAPELEAFAPADAATGVDVRAVVGLWFSESLRRATVGPSAVRLQRTGEPLTAVTWQPVWLAGDRLLVVVPSGNLAPATGYEVVLTSSITDLDGERFVPDGEGGSEVVVARFTTAAQSTGVAPRVLGSFPPDGATAQPNDRAVAVLFSKPINYLGITAAVTLTNETTAQQAGYDRVAGSANRYASDRVIVFPHLDDAVDLGATVRLDVADTLTDTEFVPQSLQAPWTARFGTLAFARPAAVAPFDAMPSDPFPPAVNLVNLVAFPVDVQEGPGAAATDLLQVRVHDQLLATGTSASAAVGAGTPRFGLDLTDDQGDPLFLPVSELVIAAFAERGGQRSTVRVVEDAAGQPDTVLHDLVPPVLLSYGPPVGPFGSQFVTDLPELRPYGTASERIAQVTTRVPAGGTAQLREVYAPSASGLFVGSAFAQPAAAEGPVPFDVELVDRAGNVSLIAAPGSAVFRGFLSDQTLAASGGALRVSACDRVALAPVAGAEVYVQDAGGGNEAFAVTGSDGSVTFGGRSGNQTVTVVAPGYHAFTVHGSDSATMSLPLVSTFPLVASTSAVFDGVNSGLVRVGGSLVVDTADAMPAPAAAADVDLDVPGFPDAVPVGLQRPGWYAAFHDVDPFPSATYLRLVGGESRVFVDPATGTSVPTLSFPMRESVNALAGSSDHVYPLHVQPGAGFDNPAQEVRVLMTTPLPGIAGQAAVGAGAMVVSNANPNAGVELELGLHGDAVVEGADPSEVFVHVYARDADGEEVVGRVPVTVAAAPGTTTVPLPAVPTVSGAWGGGAYPYTRSFGDTLGGGAGWYRMVIRDSQAQAAEWHVWIASGSAGGGSFTLPTLAMTPGGAAGVPPLTTAPGATWRARVEAFSMPAGFGSTGFFFRELYRDFLGWAQGAQGPALSF